MRFIEEYSVSLAKPSSAALAANYASLMRNTINRLQDPIDCSISCARMQVQFKQTLQYPSP
jgi:hypothetical protein